MSGIKEAYRMAHSAECRLNMEASRPDRNLRFVVGHLMAYESIRLRIVEIEHDISRSERASAVAFKGTGHVDHRLQHKPSTGQLGRRSPPPPAKNPDDNSSDSDEYPDDFMDEDEVGNLGLERFPTGTARPPAERNPQVPELEADDSSSDSDDEPVSPEEPDEATLKQCVEGEGNEDLAKIYNGIMKCPCHGKKDVPTFERMWELPADAPGSKEGITRAVAQVAV